MCSAGQCATSMAFARALAVQCRQEVYYNNKQSDDYGPSLAKRMVHNIYGVWSEDVLDILYLAPDRLIFGWNDYLPLKQIRTVNIISKSKSAANRL